MQRLGMSRVQFLLVKLAEEAAEVTQIALKASQFGLDEMCPGLPSSNAQRIHFELNDLMALIEMLNDECGFRYTPHPGLIAIKKEKVNKYADYSESLGMVTHRVGEASVADEVIEIGG